LPPPVRAAWAGDAEEAGLAMKTILLPVEEHPALGAGLDTAARLAEAFESYVEGFALIPDPPLLVSADAFSGAMIAADPDPRPPEERARACRVLFEDRMATRGLARHREGAPGPSFAWL